jgi:hypothetical protein
VGSSFAVIITWSGSIPLAVVAATLAVLTVVEAAHVPTPATIKVAATANMLVLRIWIPPANEPRHAAAQLMVMDMPDFDHVLL